MVFPHDEPHFGRVASAPGTAQALEKAGNSERRVDLEGSFKFPYIDSELECCRGAYRHERVIILHFLLGAFTVGCGKIAVMYEEAFRLLFHLAVVPQILAYGFAFFP